MEPLMSLKEVAKLIQMHEKTLVRWAGEKRIPAFKVGGVWRIKREHLEELFVY